MKRRNIMYKRFFPIFSIILLLISLVAPGIQPVAAEGNEKKEYEDGTYDVPLKVLESGNDNESMMNGYVKDNTTSVDIENGQFNVTLTLTGATMIESFKVDNGTKIVEAEKVTENEAGTERTISFAVENLDEIIQGEVSVVVPGVYDTTHDVRLQFDTSDLPLTEEESKDTEKEETDEPVEIEEDEDKDTEESDENVDEEAKEQEDAGSNDNEKTEQDGEGSEDEEENGKDQQENNQEGSTDEDKNDESQDSIDPNSSEINDGEYLINLSILHATKDEESSMGRYVENPVRLTVENGQQTISLVLSSSDMITEFLVESDGEFKETNTVSTNEEENKRAVSFNVDDLNEITNGKITVDTKSSFGEMTHDVRLSFDMDSIKEYDESTDDTKINDGEYLINLSILHATKDEESSMGRYVENPVRLTVENGQQTISLVLSSSDMITEFLVESDGEFKETNTVSTDEKGNKRTVSFNVDDLSKMTNSKIAVDTNSDFGVMQHDVRLSFDVDNIKEYEEAIDVENLKDGNYSIDFDLLHESEDKDSTAAIYVVKPAQLSVKDGVYTVYFMITDHEEINVFKIEQNGYLSSATTLEVNDEKNNRLHDVEI